MRSKIMSIVICVLCLSMMGCEGQREPCQNSVCEEYGVSNVFPLSDFNYIVKKDGRLYYIQKMAIFSSRTTRQVDITDFAEGAKK